MKASTVNNILSFFVCLLLAGLIAVVLLADKLDLRESVVPGDSDRKVRVLAVNTILAKPATSFEISRTYTGVMQAKQSVDLGFSRAGRIEKILVEPGDEVEEGDILAELDTRRLELQKTKIDDALEEQEKNKSRGPTPGGVTDVDADLVDLDLEDSLLKAPFDGIISARQMTIGSVASPGMPVFRIVQESELEAFIGVPVEVSDDMSEGEYYDLKLGAETYSTPVTAILPEVDQNARTRTVVFTLDGFASTRHRPGEVVELSLTRVNEIPGFWLPLAALTRETRGLWSVYAVEEKDSQEFVERHFVEVIHVENDRAWIRGTIGGNTRIVADGTHRIVPGQRVESRETDAGEGDSEEEAQ